MLKKDHMMKLLKEQKRQILNPKEIEPTIKREEKIYLGKYWGKYCQKQQIKYLWD